MKKNVFLLTFLGLFFQCVPIRTVVTIPSVSTGKVTYITTTTATCSDSYVEADGNDAVIVRGVCWSTSENPTTENSKTTDGTGLGTFTSNLSGLNPNTIYFVRAYATNSIGTAYGKLKTFVTEQEKTIPSVITGEITSITTTTATCSDSYVEADGNDAVIARGVCWSTTQNPTIENSKTTDGTGLGVFTSNLSGFDPNTIYYVRAYATNSIGTAYGEQSSFKTNQNVAVDTFTDSRDGNVYKTTTIGDQTWMAENLAYLPSVAGPLTGSYTELYYYVYDYDGTDVAGAKATTNYITLGVLYNWPAALTACPAGWHLPSDEEYTLLEEYLANNGYNYDGSIGYDLNEPNGPREKIAKSLANEDGWGSYTGTGTVGNTDYPAYRNKSGFSALPGGYRQYDGIFLFVGFDGYWWSSTEYDTNPIAAWGRGLYYFFNNVFRQTLLKDYGFSVRCVRDY